MANKNDVKILDQKCPWCGGALEEDISGLIYCPACKYDATCRCENCIFVDGGVCWYAGEVSPNYTCKNFKPIKF